MPKKNKIFVILPEGVSLRNFVFTNFYKTSQEIGQEVTFWNRTPMGLESFGYPEIKMSDGKQHPMADILKMSRRLAELNVRRKKSGDLVYDTYHFNLPKSNFKARMKSATIRLITKFFSTEKGVNAIRGAIFKNERKMDYYKSVLKVLQTEKPDIVFCTSQRYSKAIAPILAAQDLKIPTAVFIFSWDNMPKATLQVEADYYFVWSEHMKAELLHYYPFVKPEQIFVTGTPQFETHFDQNVIVSKEAFFASHQLDASKKYICYSGDDVTTSPNDPLYLADTADAVRKLNKKGYNLGIIFRRCPVDFSSRFDSVLTANKDIISAIDPQWKAGDHWDSIMPTREDLYLQMNTINNTEMVINLGSSMVFDYASFNKPCAYINYDYATSNTVRKDWSVSKTYNFVHFRSMPAKDCVIWINSAGEMEEIIEKALSDNSQTVEKAKEWFEKINQHPVQNASLRILRACENIISKARKA